MVLNTPTDVIDDILHKARETKTLKDCMDKYIEDLCTFGYAEYDTDDLIIRIIEELHNGSNTK